LTQTGVISQHHRGRWYLFLVFRRSGAPWRFDRAIGCYRVPWWDTVGILEVIQEWYTCLSCGCRRSRESGDRQL